MGCEALPIEYYESLDSEKRLFGMKHLHKKNAYFQAKSICKKTKSKEPCCKKVTITFDGVGVRDGAAGNKELNRRLKGTSEAGTGWSDGKTWVYDCEKGKVL
jgi:hypothetical protein